MVPLKALSDLEEGMILTMNSKLWILKNKQQADILLQRQKKKLLELNTKKKRACQLKTTIFSTILIR